LHVFYSAFCFFTSCKKKTAGGALRRAIYQTHSENSLSIKFEMGMGDICGYELTNRENSGIIILSKSKPFLQYRKKMIDKSLVKLL
jgi:hypothetical protein